MRWRGTARTLVLGAGLLLSSGRGDAADRQIRPFAGVTFAGSTTFVDPELAAGTVHPAIGISAVYLREVFGIEAEVGDAPSFFQDGDKHLVLGSRVTTVTGNVIVAAPRRWTEYWLRPYFVGGAGLMSVKSSTSLAVFDVSRVVPAVDAGGGVVAFVTNFVGVAWEIRRFQSVGGRAPDQGQSFGPESLSFWRATMAAVIRY